MRSVSATWVLGQRPLCFERRIVRVDLLLELGRQRLVDVLVLVELLFVVELLLRRPSARRSDPVDLARDAQLVERLLARLAMRRLVGKALHQVAVAPDGVAPARRRSSFASRVLLFLRRQFVGGRRRRDDPLQRAVGIELALLLVGALGDQPIGSDLLAVQLALDDRRAAGSAARARLRQRDRQGREQQRPDSLREARRAQTP